MSILTPSPLTNNELTEALARLARSGRDTTVGLVTHLAVFEARDLHLAAGFDSLFAYCTEVLRLSEHEAYHRILAARTARKHPRILSMLADGTLSLTTVRLVAPHLTDESADGLLDAAAGRSKRQVEELVARHAPRPDVPSSVRKVPVRTTSSGAMSVSSVATPTVPHEVGLVGLPPAVAGRATRASSDRAPSRPRALRGALHRQRGDVREAPTRAGPVAARDPHRRYGHGCRPRVDALDPGRRTQEVREYRSAAAESEDFGVRAQPPGACETGGVSPRCGPLRIRGYERQAVRDPRLPRVPPCHPVCDGRRGHRREHPAALSRPQWVRSEPVLWDPQA